MPDKKNDENSVEKYSGKTKYSQTRIENIK